MKRIIVFLIVTVIGFLGTSAMADDEPIPNDWNFSEFGSPAWTFIYNGTAQSGTALFGTASQKVDVLTYGVVGTSRSTVGVGVYGLGDGYGLKGESLTLGGKGVSGECSYYTEEDPPTLIIGASGVLGQTDKITLEDGTQSMEGIGVYGIGSNGSDYAVGAIGAVTPLPSEDATAAGVYGLAASETNNVFGVYGMAYGGGEDTYAIYAEGKAKVTDNLIVGKNIIVSPENIIPYEGYRNLALDFYKKMQNVKVFKSVKVETSPGKWDWVETDIIATGEVEYKAEWTYEGQFALKNLFDGMYGLWDTGETATQGLKPKTDSLHVSYEVTFDKPVYVDKFVLYFRPNPEDIIKNILYTVYAGDSVVYSEFTGMSTLGGLGKPTAIGIGDITRAVCTIINTADTVQNVGLAEWEIWGNEEQQD